MSVVYLNGEYLDKADAKISILDRGFLFADSVYEVIPVYGRRLFRLEQHLQRLDNSLAGIKLLNPLSHSEWSEILKSIVTQNLGDEQSIYLQVTRGAADTREHLFPTDIEPTVLVMSSELKPVNIDIQKQGIAVITVPDIRWQYCNLKTTALLPNVLMRQSAKDEEAGEAILIRDGYAIECSASNIFIVKDNVLITPPKSKHMLPGVTRDLILELAIQYNIDYEEQSVSEQQLESADEIWVTSSTKEVMPVHTLNGKAVGAGKPGPLWAMMFEYYQQYKSEITQGVVK